MRTAIIIKEGKKLPTKRKVIVTKTSKIARKSRPTVERLPGGLVKTVDMTRKKQYRKYERYLIQFYVKNRGETKTMLFRTRVMDILQSAFPQDNITPRLVTAFLKNRFKCSSKNIYDVPPGHELRGD